MVELMCSENEKNVKNISVLILKGFEIKKNSMLM